MTDDTDTSSASGFQGVVRNVQIACVAIYCIITGVGILGNGLVIYVTGFKMKKTVNSVWFLNLALADFLFTAFLIFSTISLAQGHHWQFGRLMCKLNNFVTVVTMFASIFLLTAISLDRCLATWMAVWAQNKRTVCKVKLISAVIWVTAAACSAPYAALRELAPYMEKAYCTYLDPTNRWILSIFHFVMGFVIPFLVILVCYIAIGVRAGRLQGIRRKRSRRIIFSVILAFFLCWLPFHIVQLIDLLDQGKHDSFVKIAGPLTVSLAFLNSCLNPILYVFMCEEFQKKIKKSICFVLESALAEDQLSFTSSRSLSSHLSRISRKSGCVAPVEKENTVMSPIFTECQVFSIQERETMTID